MILVNRLNEINQGLKEVEQYKQGNITLNNASDLLSELKSGN
tara:strand:- start:137 stop:262 length:126 start_codon:yes stop_codon:yes gene_type:complete